MRKFRTGLLSVFLFGFATASGWGFEAHKRINEAAVYSLPPELFRFYKLHVDEITKRAVNADMRRYVNAGEACRHFLDADHYEARVPLDTIPRKWQDALAVYGEDSLMKHGIVPWNLLWMKYSLSRAFEEKNIARIIRLSADIGHYAGDLHVPLHSTGNYNGQRTGQEGIHALWESRVFSLYQNHYDYFTGRAVYLSDPSATIWERFAESFAALDSVLGFERLVREQYPDPMVYEARGNTMVKVYHEAFCRKYHEHLSGMVERRMRGSVLLTASLWYTCWVDAGQPDLFSVQNVNGESAGPPEEPEWTGSEIPTGSMIGRKEE